MSDWIPLADENCIVGAVRCGKVRQARLGLVW